MPPSAGAGRRRTRPARSWKVIRQPTGSNAVLHKIEGDESNSRYWYRRSGQSYESWSDPKAELAAIKAVLTY